MSKDFNSRTRLERRQFLLSTAGLAALPVLAAPAAGGPAVGAARPLAPGWVVRDGWILPAGDL
jgi:hypothetical protein